MPVHRPRETAPALLILAAASWGLGTVVSKRAVDEIPPVPLLAVQLFASAVTLTLALRILRRPIRGRTGPALLGRLGVLNPGLAYALGLAGLTSITASLSVLLWVAEPVLIVALAALVIGERVQRAFVLWSGVALAGMVLVLYQPGTGGSLVGIGLTLAGVACCAVYSVLTRRMLGPSTETAPVVLLQQAYGLATALVLLLVATLTGLEVVPDDVSAAGWISAVISGILYYAAAYAAYLAALRRVPASRAAASFYLIPVFGIGGGMALLGETLAPVQLLGAAAVVVAVAGALMSDPAAGPVDVRTGAAPGARDVPPSTCTET